tara:strand:- start:219 stop:911 length:693 start_codon:yes stop_codon:yes gene_type:complete
MDKTADRINRQTLEFSNRIYEELSTIVCQRGDLRYFNYDHNDEKIDGKLERMFELLDDIYNSCIEKKTGWITRKPGTLQPNNLVFPEEDDMPDVDVHTPEPRTPEPRTPTKLSKVDITENPMPSTPQAPIKKKKSKKKKIKVDESDTKVKDVFETIMYSSDEEIEEITSNPCGTPIPCKPSEEEIEIKKWIENNQGEYYNMVRCYGVVKTKKLIKNIIKKEEEDNDFETL